MLVIAACSPGPALGEFDQIEIEVGAHPMTVLVADTPSQRSQGLRGVDEMPVGVDGMLFVFEAARTVTFAMRDTVIPLDVWWFDQDGHLVGAAEMEPCSADPCTNHRSPPGVKWALETPAGEVDVDPGDLLNATVDG